MNAPHPPATWIPRRVARLFQPVLDRIDSGLAVGQIDIFLPDGSFRVLGGRAAGPSCTVIVRRWRAFLRLARSGSVGWYEAWAAGDWSSPDIVTLFELFARNRATLKQTARAKGLSRIVKRVRHAFNRNDRAGARRNIVAHYDLGNDFYAAWLDPTMSYSSAIFAAGDTLEMAQRRKQAAVLDRLGLAPGDNMLEIGCGWGSLSQAAHERGTHVTAISLSPSQLDFARAHYGDVDFRLCDYRDAMGQFDAIASVEMVEAVGERYWPDYLDTIARCLKLGGRAAIQFISIPDDMYEAYRAGVDFIQTYVFPGGMLLSESRFRALAEARGLAWTDEHRFGADYAETVKIWRTHFEAATLPPDFDNKFKNLWRYYLMYCEGGFRSGGIDVVQVTLVNRA
jgi:cyclopropane-fatty-acyl-phospholipid synthase